jgi:hypothetical protein
MIIVTTFETIAVSFFLTLYFGVFIYIEIICWKSIKYFLPKTMTLCSESDKKDSKKQLSTALYLLHLTLGLDLVFVYIPLTNQPFAWTSWYAWILGITVIIVIPVLYLVNIWTYFYLKNKNKENLK